MDTQSHAPPLIVAVEGTAGIVLLKVWIGHEFGGHGIMSRFTPGQHGFSPHAYRTPVMLSFRSPIPGSGIRT